MNRTQVFLLSIIFATVGLDGCARLKDGWSGSKNDAPPGRVVAIARFKCNCDPLVQESIQDSFVDVFFKSTNAKPIKGESGDIVISGLLTVEQGSTGTSKGELGGAGSGSFAAVGGSSKSSSAAGAYVSGITVQAYKNGQMIATYSAGQNLGEGRLISPVSLGKDAASYLAKVLVRQHEIGRRER